LNIRDREHRNNAFEWTWSVGAAWCSEASRWSSGWKSRQCRLPSWHCSDIRRRGGWPNRRKPGCKRPRWLDV